MQWYGKVKNDPMNEKLSKDMKYMYQMKYMGKKIRHLLACIFYQSEGMTLQCISYSSMLSQTVERWIGFSFEAETLSFSQKYRILKKAVANYFLQL